MLQALSSWKVALSIGIFLFLLDFVTKQLTVHFLELGKSEIPLFNILGIECSITYAINRGAAWGFFSDFQHLLLAFRILLILGLIIYLAVFSLSPLFRTPLIMIISGALGNVVDFFLYGHVIDMIHFQFWGYDYPVFNVADATIFIGTLATLILSFFVDEKHST